MIISYLDPQWLGLSQGIGVVDRGGPRIQTFGWMTLDRPSLS